MISPIKVVMAFFLISISIFSFSWEVFFNSPPNPLNLKKSLLDLIDSSKKSVHIAIYNLDDEDIITLLEGKQKAGIDIKIVTEGQNYLKNFKKLSNFDVIADPLKNGLMHSKYIIVDGEYVWCGSANLTKTSFYNDFNNAIVFRSFELADVFEKNFQGMRDGFFTSKGEEATTVEAEGVRIDVRFSPSSDIFDLSLDLLKHARSEVDIAVYSFSDPRIALILSYLDQRGVKVRLLVDDGWNSGSYSFIPKMNEFGFIKKYKVNNGLLHHKYMIIDPHGKDPVVVIGSYNITLSAERKNNEVFLFIHSKEIVSKYLDNFNKLYK